MPTSFYPVFREYSLAVQSWLRNLVDLPQLASTDCGILSITLRGTTVAPLSSSGDQEQTTDGMNQHEVKLDTKNHTLKAAECIKLYGTTAITTGPDGQQIVKSNDEWYVILAVKDDVIILDKAYKKLSLEQPGAGGRIRKVVNVMYGEMQDAIARIASPLRNGLITTPGLSFYLSDYQAKEGMRPKENYYTRRYFDKDGKKIGSAAVPPLQEYELTYSINIWSPYRSYMSMLQYQIQSEFAPQKFFWIPGFGSDDDKFGMDYTDGTNNCRYDREHHGQWAHSLIEGVIDASELEPGSNAQRMIRTEITFNINNAFMALPFEREQPYIGEVSIEQHIEERINRL